VLGVCLFRSCNGGALVCGRFGASSLLTGISVFSDFGSSFSCLSSIFSFNLLSCLMFLTTDFPSHRFTSFHVQEVCRSELTIFPIGTCLFLVMNGMQVL